MQPINDKDFNDIIFNAELPVIVQFSAGWCGPCKQLTPIMKEVEKDYEGKVDFFKMDVDHNPQTPVEYGIRGIPTTIIFNGGKGVASKVGGMSKKELVDLVDGVL